jgi:hypothetical protein
MILAPKCMQNTDYSSKKQQVAGEAAPDWKTQKNNKKNKKILKKYTLHNISSTATALTAQSLKFLKLNNRDRD